MLLPGQVTKVPPLPLSLTDFHAGSRPALERCYREHYHVVAAAVARVLRGVDAENVVHEVFYRVLSRDELRASFRGGNLGAWLARVAHNAAIDYARRHARETAHADRAHDEHAAATTTIDDPQSERLDAKLLVKRFQRERLPPELSAVFEARFLQQLPQREAARELRMPRTTLAYQEQRIRAMLRRFLLEGEEAR